MNIDKNTVEVNQSQQQNYTITCKGPSSLIFNGVPNETKTGEVTYIIHANFKCKRYIVSINGTPFMNGETSLDTIYQSGNDQTWYKAGEPFLARGIMGTINTIRFQAASGPNASSQRAGTYTAKLAITVLSFE